MRQNLGRLKTNLSTGVVGLANVGKSTFFQALTKTTLGIPANYPFATIDPETARVSLPSQQLEKLCEIYKPARVFPASLEVVDIAGLVRGAAKGAGLGNAFLSQIRATDGLLQVVRAFEDPEIVHVDNSVDPLRDLETVRDELILKDMEYVLSQLETAQKSLKNNPTKEKREFVAAGAKVMQLLESGKRVGSKSDWTDPEVDAIRQMALLTSKPTVVVANVAEEEYCFGGTSNTLAELRLWAKESYPDDEVVCVSVELEARLSTMDEDARAKELGELGVESALPQTVLALRRALGLHSFFTAGPEEVHEWTIREGTKAAQAAGVIHTDLERTFICANVMKMADIEKYNGDEAALKRSGRVLTKGKDYIVETGDVVHFRSGAGKR